MAGENVFGNPIIIPAGGYFGFGSDASDAVVIAINPGDPNGVVAANQGSFILDTTTPALWQNTDGATAWANAAALAGAGFFTTPPGGLPVGPGGGGLVLIPHGLPAAPSFVQWSYASGTDGAADGPGPFLPLLVGPGAPLVTADAVNIIVDMSLVVPTNGGFFLTITAG